MDDPRNRQNDHLGVNKTGKNIRKGPLQQPNFTTNPSKPPQPQIYNVSKNDFRSFVQQHTGSPSREPSPAYIPPNNPPNPPNSRLQRVRPAPLTEINRPVPPPQPQTSIRPVQPFIPGGNVAESPISAYMRYLQTSITNPSPKFNQMQTQNPTQFFNQGQFQGQQFPSPSGFVLSPRSPYRILSPRLQFPPITPNFAFSHGILGPGPLAPPSPGFFVPFSPSGFFPGFSPKWRDQ